MDNRKEGFLFSRESTCYVSLVIQLEKLLQNGLCGGAFTDFSLNGRPLFSTQSKGTELILARPVIGESFVEWGYNSASNIIRDLATHCSSVLVLRVLWRPQWALGQWECLGEEGSLVELLMKGSSPDWGQEQDSYERWVL